jgi:hypothetical protein
MSRTGTILVAIGAWATISVFGLYRGCSSSALPPAPTKEEIAKVKATHFKATVGVERYQYPVYSEHLIESLRRTKLFDEVAPLDQLPNPTLIARVERRIYGTATIPILTALSLGFIPTTVQEEWGESFSLHGKSPSIGGVGVDFSYVGPSTLGWWAAVRSLSSDISTVNPRRTKRFYDALAVAICSEEVEIRRIMTAE